MSQDPTPQSIWTRVPNENTTSHGGRHLSPTRSADEHSGSSSSPFHNHNSLFLLDSASSPRSSISSLKTSASPSFSPSYSPNTNINTNFILQTNLLDSSATTAVSAAERGSSAAPATARSSTVRSTSLDQYHRQSTHPARFNTATIVQDDTTETTESALADILSGQVRPQFRSSSLVSPRVYDQATLGSSPPLQHSTGTAVANAGRSYFSPVPPFQSGPGFRPRSQSSTGAFDSSLRHQMNNALNGVYDQFGQKPPQSNIETGSNPIRIGGDPDQSVGGGGGNNVVQHGSVGSSRPRYNQFATGSYSGAGFDQHGWKSPTAELGGGVRHASFSAIVGGGWADGEQQRQGRQRLRDEYNRPWAAADENARDFNESSNAWSEQQQQQQQSGIGFSNMSPFTRDGGRTLGDAPSGFEGGAALYKARRDYSLGAVGSGRKRSDSEWGRDRPLKEAEDEDEDSFAPPTRSGATSRRHSFAAFNPISRSQVGFHLPDEERDKASSGSTTFPSGGIGSNALRSRMGSSAIDDDDLAADLNSLQLNLEAHAASQQEEAKRQVSFVGSMPTHFPTHHDTPSSGSKALADDSDDALEPSVQENAGSPTSQQQERPQEQEPTTSTTSSTAPSTSLPASTMPMLSPPIGSSRYFQPSPSPATTSVTASNAQRSTSRFDFGPEQSMSSPSMSMGLGPAGDDTTSVRSLHDFGLSAFGPSGGYLAAGSRPLPPPVITSTANMGRPPLFGQSAGGMVMDNRFNGGPSGYHGPSPAPPPFQAGGLPPPGGGFSPFPTSSTNQPYGMNQQPFGPAGIHMGAGGMKSPMSAPGGASTQPGGGELVNLGRGVPLHSVPANAPLFIVEFKAGRKDLFYVDDPTLQLKQGDLVIVEADRGRDVGKFFKPCTLDEVQAFQQRLVEMALGQLATAGQLGGGQHSSPIGQPPPNAAALARMTKEFQPKKLYGKASPSDTQMLLSKAQDEVKALALIRSKVAQKNLPMEVCDAEWQWDRRKLTFYYTADQRVDFRELVRELFRVYKTRVWMCCLDQQSGAWDFK
ncbi:hypothetical protein OIO90_001880 [Microbotryomycetes sp. JL221]|nr:hypothetical protein OIO90_001880 [Microbotryomycetes sp. JL221]